MPGEMNGLRHEELHGRCWKVKPRGTFWRVYSQSRMSATNFPISGRSLTIVFRGWRAHPTETTSRTIDPESEDHDCCQPGDID